MGGAALMCGAHACVCTAHRVLGDRRLISPCIDKHPSQSSPSPSPQDLRNNWREPARAEMRVYRERVAACFGVPFTQHTAVGRPLRVLFINRHYEEGRNILNAAALAHKIRRLPEFRAFPGGAELEIRYLEGDQSLREQASLFWNASLLIWPHGATMSHVFFLPQGAQAIEVVPWVQRDKASLPEWVRAIRDAYGLRVRLYDVQNAQRARSMFNQDKMLEYDEYRALGAEQKIALLERGECPAGVSDFLCPFWWNHWKVSVNFDWAQLEPLVKEAIGRLRAGWNEEPPLLPKKRLGPHNTPPSPPPPPVVVEAHPPPSLVEKAVESPPPTTTSSTSNSPPTPPPVTRPPLAPPDSVVPFEWLTAPIPPSTVPLSSFKCVHDDGAAERRFCVFHNIVLHGGQIYYIAEGGQASPPLPEIRIAWEEWLLDAADPQDAGFVPRVVAPEELPPEPRAALEAGRAEAVSRAALVHAVDTGNFYHLLSEVAATQFAAQCGVLGLCDAAARAGVQLFFIQPDPTRRYIMPYAPRAAFECLGGGAFRNMRVPPVSSQVRSDH